jgi:hypothetical protein
MAQRAQLLVCLTVVAAATTVRASVAETKANPYLAIVERNAFGLHPVPKAPPPKPKETKAEEDIRFTGISRDGSGKRAYLVVTDKPTKRGQQASVEYYCLGEGQREGEIEVKTIDEAAETVTLLKGAELLTLNFKDNGNPPTEATPTPPPGLLRHGPPRPGTPAALAAERALRARQAHFWQAQHAGRPVAGRPVGNAAMEGLRALPTRDLRVQPQTPPVDPAAQRALMEIQAQLNAGKNMPPLPSVNIPPPTGR